MSFCGPVSLWMSADLVSSWPGLNSGVLCVWCRGRCWVTCLGFGVTGGYFWSRYATVAVHLECKWRKDILILQEEVAVKLRKGPFFWKTILLPLILNQICLDFVLHLCPDRTRFSHTTSIYNIHFTLTCSTAKDYMGIHSGQLATIVVSGWFWSFWPSHPSIQF